MLTDWVLIGRLARELEERARSARVEDAGLLADGRIALALRRRDVRMLLAVDMFASAPLVTLESGELGVGIEPGFARTLARVLGGTTLRSAAARSHDRLLRLKFGSRSRFGVGEEIDLYVELVPRFGNLVLVKDGTIVAAYKEFAPSQNARRPVQTGAPYILPPVPDQPKTLTKQPPGSALEYFADLRERHVVLAGNERADRRRRALRKRLDERERKVRDELEQLADKRGAAQARDVLRTEGETIFSTLHTVGEPERDAAKERAAKLFAQYKKLGKSLPHIDARERELRIALDGIETLRWEAERTGDEDLAAVEGAIAQLSPQRPVPGVPAPRRKRPLHELRTLGGSRIVVGRSPVENAELTFRFARPNDLWFHAQRIPGAHVILARDDRGAVPDEDVAAAASLAAFYSRAKSSTSVPVDYTQRKHVRKQRAAAPGLVWYTEAKTIVVAPRALEALRDEVMEASPRTPSNRD